MALGLVPLRFYMAELAERRELGYPPFGRMVAVRADGVDEQRTRRVLEELASIARRHPGLRDGTLSIQGPAPAPIARLRNRWRFRFLLRGERKPLRQVAAALAARIDEGLGPVRASVDVDPVSML